MKNFKRRLIALSLALSMLNASGCSKSNNKSDNNMSSASTSTSVWDEIPDIETEEKEIGITVKNDKDLSEIVSRYKSLIMAYNGVYPYSEYYLTHEEFLSVLENSTSSITCPRSYQELDVFELSMKIYENYKRAVESQEIIELLASKGIDVSLDDINYIGLEPVLGDSLHNIFKNATNNINEDICLLEDIVVVVSSKTIGDFCGIWFPDINVVCLNYPVIEEEAIKHEISVYDYSVITLSHELEHVRQTKCEHRMRNKWNDLNYLGSCVTFMMEASAESSLYNLKIDKDYSRKTNYDYTYSQERQLEANLLLLGITNESVDGYYNAILDSDLEALFQYFGLTTLEEQETFYKILYAFDTISQRTDLVPSVHEGPYISIGELEAYGGYGCYTDVFKLALENLMEYTHNNPEFTLQDNLALFNIIRNLIVSGKYYFQKDENGETIKDENGHFITLYDEDFVTSILGLEKTYLEFLSEYYDIPYDEVCSLLDDAVDINLSRATGSDACIFTYDFDSNSVFAKYPVLKSIIYTNYLSYYAHSAFLEDTGLSLERTMKNS